MELTNDFQVALPLERAWAVLTDLERIAPCMPGAQLQEVEGDVYRGIVKVKVGPATAQYKGEARFLERDEDAHVAVLLAEGRETRGQGNAKATITARLTDAGSATAVSLTTDLAITGRVAQFGRGVLADVSANLLSQFGETLEQTVLADEAAAPADSNPPADTSTPESSAAATDAAPSQAAPPTAVRTIDAPEPTPVDLMGAAGTPVIKRVGVLVALVVGGLLVRKLLSRLRVGGRRAEANA